MRTSCSDGATTGDRPADFTRTFSESCIKGHRSSNCQHADRPLFEIKKKGRPVSQCEKCRELRKTKRMHSKCTCTAVTSSEAGPSSQAPVPKAAVATDGSAPKPKSEYSVQLMSNSPIESK